MTDLLTVEPSFPIHQYAHLIHSLEKASISTTDLLTLDSIDIAKRARLPALDVKGLTEHVLATLQIRLGVIDADHGNESTNELCTRGQQVRERVWETVTLDDELSQCTRGFPAGYLSEVVGESGAGKTQLLLQLLLRAQLPAPYGLGRPSLYISTEHSLPITRLAQILETLQHQDPAYGADLSLANVISIHTPDLESQDHILTYQVPVALERHNIGLIVIDSIAANYREKTEFGKRAANLGRRSAQLIKTGALLRRYARRYNCAVVVANQVSDRFSPDDAQAAANSGSAGTVLSSQRSTNSNHSATHLSVPPHPPPPPSSSASSASANDQQQLDARISDSQDHFTLNHQQRFFTGWGDVPPSMSSPAPTQSRDNFAPTDPSQNNLKTPSLGLTWANQIACRIVLTKEFAVHNTMVDDTAANSNASNGIIGHAHAASQSKPKRSAGVDRPSWRRYMRLVFAPWAPPTAYAERVGFEIWAGGVRAVKHSQ